MESRTYYLVKRQREGTHIRKTPVNQLRIYRTVATSTISSENSSFAVLPVSNVRRLGTPTHLTRTQRHIGGTVPQPLVTGKGHRGRHEAIDQEPELG